MLPMQPVQDAQRIARFRREAEVLASLNHSNIGSIYGLEESGTSQVLVLELIEGEDLAQRIGRGIDSWSRNTRRDSRNLATTTWFCF